MLITAGAREESIRGLGRVGCETPRRECAVRLDLARANVELINDDRGEEGVFLCIWLHESIGRFVAGFLITNKDYTSFLFFFLWDFYERERKACFVF